MVVKFKHNKRAQVARIVARATFYYMQKNKMELDTLSLNMDLSAVLAQGQVKMDLDKLEAFDDFNFMHDIAGIVNNMDRDTGLLVNCFLPRCARPTKEMAHG